MQVILAKAMGLCMGVRRALEVAEQVECPERVTIYGELVHNEIVQGALAARGFRTCAETDRGEIPQTPEVLVTAHGLSDRRRRELEGAGKRLIDTTCPLVRRLHRAAGDLAAAGYDVLVIGRRGHVEVQGVVEDLPRYEVISAVDEVRSYPSRRLGLVCQTTTPPWLAEAIHRAVCARNPGAAVRFVDTICRPTRDRQVAMAELLAQVDAVVVVGGRNSNNTRALVRLCRKRGVRAYHLVSAAELCADWFRGCKAVGLTAGTSTLDATIQEVRRVLEQLAAGVAA